MTVLNPNDDLSWCPSCGKESSLNSVSGFCIPCTKDRFPDKAVCDSCGKIEARGQFRTICQDCQEREWFDRNADRIELYMGVGLTKAMAVTQVLFENRPICHSCKEKIKWGRKGWHFFCTRTQRCKSAGIKFHHLIHKKGKPREEALQETLDWLKERAA